MLIHPSAVSVGRHTVAYERKRTWEDPKHPKGLETIQEAVCRIRVSEVWHRPVGQVTYVEAKAGGYANLHLFLAALEAQRYVWVASFELVRDDDPVRLLARGGGYTSSPALAIDELEAVSSGVQSVFSKEAQVLDHLREQQRRKAWEAKRDAMKLDERYREEVERAQRLGTDVSREEAALRRTVENMRRKNDRRAA